MAPVIQEVRMASKKEKPAIRQDAREIAREQVESGIATRYMLPAPRTGPRARVVKRPPGKN